MQESNIILYETEDGKINIDVVLKDETIWLTQKSMAELFDCSKDNIVLHLKNIFLDEELNKNTTTEIFSVVQKEENRNVKRNVYYYNLDMIISVGYRVKSENGIIFRKWATKVLKDYMITCYAVNQKRLEYLEKTIKKHFIQEVHFITF